MKQEKTNNFHSNTNIQLETYIYDSIGSVIKLETKIKVVEKISNQLIENLDSEQIKKIIEVLKK